MRRSAFGLAATALFALAPAATLTLTVVSATPVGAAPTGCSAGSPAYGVGISITPEFVGTNDVAIAAYVGEQVNYDVTVFLRAEAGGVIVCPIFNGTVTISLPNGSGPFTVATGVALNVGQSVTFGDVPGTAYTVDRNDAKATTPWRVEAMASIAAMSDGPDNGPQDDAPVTATAVAPTFLLAPSTALTIAADRSIVATGGAVTWTVTERNDTLAGYFPQSLAQARVELSTNGGATVATTLTAATPGMTGDDGNALLDVGEAWTWTVTTNPTDDVTMTATGFGTGPRGRVITFPGDPEERAAAFVDTIAPSTAIGISAAPTAVPVGAQTTWTITETNDGDSVLTSPFVRVDADGGDDGDVATLVAPPASGDVDGDGALDPGETWSWTMSTVVSSDVTLTATGHGTDPLGRDITFPADPQERAAASVTAIPPPPPPTQAPPPPVELPATGATGETRTMAAAGLATLVGGAALVLVAARRPRRVRASRASS